MVAMGAVLDFNLVFRVVRCGANAELNKPDILLACHVAVIESLKSLST